MKHILNNLTEEEKKSIRGQHTGGMNVVNENFKKLINNKLGTVKPLLFEQSVPETMPYSLIGNKGEKAQQAGYSVVKEINLADGEYIGKNGNGLFYLCDKSGNYTGYIVRGVTYRGPGAYETNITIQNKTNTHDYSVSAVQRGEPLAWYKKQEGSTDQNTETQKKPKITNKVASEGIKNVTPEMISSPQFKGTYSGYVFGGTFNGVNYEWDCNGVPGMSGVRGMVEGEIITEIAKNMFTAIKKTPGDNNPESPCVGFYSKNGSFVIYTTSDGKTNCINF